MPDAVVEAHLADTVAIVGQTDLDAERIARAPALRAVVNVEGNFLRNVDYDACFARGIHVLVASPAFAPAVAEAALGMAIDLARGITRGRPRHARRHRGLRARGQPRLRSCSPAATSASSGWATSGRELVRLLAPFRCRVRAHDPWLPDLAVRAAGAEPAGLDDLLRASRVVFVFAAPDDRQRWRCSAGASSSSCRTAPSLLVMSRAAVVDLDALVELAAAGRLRAADRRVAARARARRPSGPLRGGRCCSRRIAPAGCPRPSGPSARLAVADLELVLRGLPPVACRRAERETVGRLRSRPIDEPE